MQAFTSIAFIAIGLVAVQPVYPEDDSEWYLLVNGMECEAHDPRQLIAMSQMVGVSLSIRDVKEAGKVVATTITAPDGSEAKYFRGKARCEQSLTRARSELDRYK